MAAASLALRRGMVRLAGALLLVSAVTPTYFAWVLNIHALVVGVALAASPDGFMRRPAPAA